MRYIYYRKGDKHKERIILVRKTVKEAFAEARYGDGFIITAEDIVFQSVEHLITFAEDKVKAGKYVPVGGLIDANRKHITTKQINDANYKNASAKSRKRGGFRSKPSNFNRDRLL